MTDYKNLSPEEWREKLSDEQYRVTREKGTEPPFTGIYADCKKPGTYMCVCCDEPLFRSTDKYDSGTGWPSYLRPYSPESVKMETDNSLGMVRVEALCAKCDSHLGHVFPDGPAPTNTRFCINSASLNLKEEE